MNEQQVGTKSWLELQEENNKQYTPLTSDNVYIPSTDLWRTRSAYRGAEEIRTPLMGAGDYLGKSKYDPAVSSFADLDNYQDIRANSQSGWLKVGAGLAKGAITAGTTFISGTAGLAMGLVQGTMNAFNGDSFWEGLWDNDITKGLNEINRAAEEFLPNYYTKYEQAHPLAADSIFSWNFLGDKFIKNVGFTVGAFFSGKALTGLASMGGKVISSATKLGKAVSKGLRGASLISSDLEKASNIGNATAALIGSTLSAVNEGSIEAINSSEDFFKLGEAKLQDDLNSKLTRAEIFKNLDPEGYNEYTTRIRDEYKVKNDKLKEESAKVGNLVLALNVPILIASNLFQFGKLYSRGFKTASKGVGFNKGLGEFFNDTRREAEKKTLSYRIIKGVANGLSEGKEEVLQQLASDYSGTLHSPSNKDFYNLGLYSAEIDPLFNYTTTEWTKAAASTFMNTMKQESTWEQFIIGSLTGFLGMPVFGRANTENAYLGKNKAVGLAGGLLGEIFDKPIIDETIDSKVEALNQRMQDPNFKAYYKSLIRNNKFEAIKNAAAIAGDKKTFKDAEYAQLLSDSILFYETGQLDVFEDMLRQINLTDENIDDIISTTTSQQTMTNGDNGSNKDSGVYYGPFVDSYGNPLNKKEIKKKVESKINELLGIVDGIGRYSDYIDSKFGNNLQREQKNELLYTYLRRDNLIQRSNELLKDIRDKVAKSIDNDKWSKYLSKDERELLKKFSLLGEGQSIEDAGIDVKTLNTALSKFGSNLDKVYNVKNQESLNKTLDFVKTIVDMGLIEDDIEKTQSDIDTWEKDINKLKEKHQAETQKAAKQTQQNIQKNATLAIADKINKAQSEQELHNSIRNENISDLFDLLEESSNPIAKGYLTTLRAVDYLKNKIGKSLSNQEYSILSDLFNNFLKTDGKYENLNSDNDNLFNIVLIPDNISDKESLINKFKKLISENKPSKEELESEYSRPYRVTDEDFTEYEDSVVVSNNDEVPDINESKDNNPTPIAPPDGDNIQIGMVAQEIKAGDEAEAVSDTGLADAYNESSKDTIEDIDSNAGTQRKYAKTATPKYTAESLNGSMTKAPQWTMQGKNGEIHPVRAYLEKNGAFNFVDSGKLYEHSKEDKTVYFGIDPELGEKDILIFVKLKDGSYQVIGNNFLAPSFTSKTKGLEQLNKDVYEEYAEWKKNGGKGKFIAKSRIGTLHNIRRGRIKVSDSIRPVREAIIASTINRNPILAVVVNKALFPSIDTKGTINLFDKHNGQVKLIVQNPAGTESLITATPKKVEIGDIQNSNDKISDDIRKAFESLLNLFKSGLDHNSNDYKTGIKKAKSDLFRHLSARELGITSDGNKIYFSKIDRTKIVVDSKGYKVHPSTVFASINLNDITTTDEKDKTNAYFVLENALSHINARFRVNQEAVANTDSRLGVTSQDWLNSDKLTTHAMSLDLEASWFDYEVIEDGTKKLEETKPGELNPQEQKEADIKAERRRNTRSKLLAMESTSELKPSTTRENKTREQIRKEVAEKLSKIIPISETDSIRIVETLMLDDNPCEALIDLDDKLIYLSEGAVEGAEYHEAFHYVSQLLLSQPQRESIYKEAKSIFGELSNELLEERLAEDFRNYMNMNIIPKEYNGLAKLKRWFSNLKNKIKFYIEHRNTGVLKSLYKDIMNGKFADADEVNNEASGKKPMEKEKENQRPQYLFNLNNEEDAKRYRDALDFYNRYIAVYKNGVKLFSKKYLAEEHIAEMKKICPYIDFYIDWNRDRDYYGHPIKSVILKPKVFEGTSRGQIIDEQDRIKIKRYNEFLMARREHIIGKAIELGYDEELLEVLDNKQIENMIRCSGVK